MKIWHQAHELALNTPAERNRYVDFLRGFSILFVISGHWLITGAFVDPQSGDYVSVLALEIVPWTEWLTWLFQVMPVFFMVGGYANAVSLESALARGVEYRTWLATRLHRLLRPMLLLILVWTVIAGLLFAGGIRAESVQFITRVALLPTWFLAIYTMIVILAPPSHAAWRRWGYKSLLVYLLLAAATDFAFFASDWKLPNWSNYFWVWLAVHHLGYAWRDGRQGNPVVLLAVATAALGALVLAVVWGPYPVAMAGSPGDGPSNSLPPKLTLAALGMVQFGVLLAIERPMRRLLENPRLWTATVLINSMIMTVYLWHMSILLLLLGASWFAGGIGLGLQPGSIDWWWARIPWVAIPALLLLPAAISLSPLERMPRPTGAPAPPLWRQLPGAALVGLGISLTALFGIDGNPLSPANTGIVALVLGGAWMCGITYRFR
ncbi:MAG: acyltransferase [Gammaproteobacteria bacterium]|nr:acyltransferase [Gammaproteobacteria bacterium]